MGKFLGQGLTPHHSSDYSHNSDNAGSLTYCSTRELWKIFKNRERNTDWTPWKTLYLTFMFEHSPSPRGEKDDVLRHS